MNITVFVVGGDTDIGLLIARHFVRAGVQRIGLIARDTAAGEAAAQAIFQQASGMWSLSASGDLTSTADVERMIEQLSSSLGDADIVIDCLGEDGTLATEAANAPILHVDQFIGTTDENTAAAVVAAAAVQLPG